MDMYYVPYLIELVEVLMNKGTVIYLEGSSTVDLRILRDRLVLYGDEWIAESDLRNLMEKIVHPGEIILH